MTEKDFQKFDSKVSGIAYASLVIALFTFVDYLVLLRNADLSEFGRTWSLPVFIIGLVLFASLQSLRVVAHSRRYTTEEN